MKACNDVYKDITIEEFDKIVGNHIFTEEYQEEKKSQLEKVVNSSVDINSVYKERKRVHFTRKKVAVLIAACFLTFGSVGIASAGIDQIISSTTPNEYTKYEQIGKVQSKLGYNFKSLETFSNGYSFQDMSLVNNESRDENGNTLDQYVGIGITYAKDEKTLEFDVDEASNVQAGESVSPDQSKIIDGINVDYFVTTYKWVPMDYEITEEESNLMEQGKLNISTGDSDNEITQNEISYVVWTQDGISYSLMNLNGLSSSNDLFGMAEELIILE